jgi:hypothetical protein
MEVRHLAVLCLIALTVAAPSQSPGTQYVYFSTRFVETPRSGRGGHAYDLAPPTHPLVMGLGYRNEAAVLDPQGFAVVLPGAPNMTPVPSAICPNPPACPPLPPMVVDFQEIAGAAQLDLECGDTNGNGIYNETTNGSPTGTSTNIAGIDAIWIPNPPASRAANLHECFISTFAASPGAMGYRGAPITPADVFLLPSAPNFYPAPSSPAPPIFFLRQSDLETFFCMGAGTGAAMNVDAFAVDVPTGDIYLSFDGLSPTNPAAFIGSFFTGPGIATTAAVHAGDVFRIPAWAFAPAGPYGVVTAPLPGHVERIYTAADLAAVVAIGGGCVTGVPYLNTTGLDIDDTQSVMNLAPCGFGVRPLFFTIDNRGAPAAACSGSPVQNLTATAIYTTGVGGAFAVLNGITMNTPAALGMSDFAFDGSSAAGPIDALDVVELPTPWDPVAGAPFHLDARPTGYGTLMGPAPTPVVTGYVAGAAPGATIGILMRADVQVSGGFIDRYSTGWFENVAGHPDLFMDFLSVNNQKFVLGPSYLWPLGQDLLAVSMFNGGPGFSGQNPIPTWSDPNVWPHANNGDSAFSIDLSPFVGIWPFPFVLTFQALDLTQEKLSDAVSVEFN